MGIVALHPSSAWHLVEMHTRSDHSEKRMKKVLGCHTEASVHWVKCFALSCTELSKSAAFNEICATGALFARISCGLSPFSPVPAEVAAFDLKKRPVRSLWDHGRLHSDASLVQGFWSADTGP